MFPVHLCVSVNVCVCIKEPIIIIILCDHAKSHTQLTLVCRQTGYMFNGNHTDSSDNDKYLGILILLFSNKMKTVNCSYRRPILKGKWFFFVAFGISSETENHWGSKNMNRRSIDMRICFRNKIFILIWKRQIDEISVWRHKKRRKTKTERLHSAQSVRHSHSNPLKKCWISVS